MALGTDFPTTLAAARTGAEWAWRDLYLDLAPTLLGYLRRQGARDAEDLLAEVMLQVVRSLDTFDGDEDGFRSWVFTIAHHRLIDARRYHARRPADPSPTESIEPALPADPSATEAEAVDRLTSEEIGRLLDVLTGEQREVLLLRVAGFTIAEVAGIVGRTENATKALQRRGLRALQRHLEISDQPYPYDVAGRSRK